MKRCLSCGATFDGEWRCRDCGHAPHVVQGFLSFAPGLAVEEHDVPDFETLAAVEAGNFWFRARNRLIVWAMRCYFARAASMLEIGCGTGFVLSGIRAALPDLVLNGSEAYCAGLAFAARRVPAATFFQMDARDIPFCEEYDVVGAFDVLEHIQDDERVLAEMYRTARSGGGIVVTVPQHPFLWSTVDEVAGHFRRYRAPELAGKISRAGFRVVRMTSFVSLLLPVMIASRLMRREAKGKEVATDEFTLSSAANSALECLLDLERGVIRLGLSLPVGGSLLIVAAKD